MMLPTAMIPVAVSTRTLQDTLSTSARRAGPVLQTRTADEAVRYSDTTWDRLRCTVARNIEAGCFQSPMLGHPACGSTGRTFLSVGACRACPGPGRGFRRGLRPFAGLGACPEPVEGVPRISDGVALCKPAFLVFIAAGLTGRGGRGRDHPERAPQRGRYGRVGEK